MSLNKPHDKIKKTAFEKVLHFFFPDGSVTRGHLRALLFIYLTVIIVMQIGKVFSEGNVFSFIPHNYAVSALQSFYHRPIRGLYGDDSTYDKIVHENFRFSPIFFLSRIFARLGEPTPPWFRLSGVFFLALIFLLAWYRYTGADPPIDRILGSVLLVQIPCINFVGGVADDHPIHIFLLVSALVLAVRSEGGIDRGAARIFYFLPALDLLSRHMVTNYFLFMFNYSGIYIGTVLMRKDRLNNVRAWMEEAGLFIAGAAGIFLVATVQFGDLKNIAGQSASFLSYYLDESRRCRDETLSFLRILPVYPEVIFFGTCGPVAAVAASMNFVKKYRSRFIALYLPALVVPLWILTFFGKKQTVYAWYLTPTLAFMAADSLAHLSKGKKIAVVLFFLTLGPIFLMEGLIDKKPLDAEPLFIFGSEEVFQKENIRVDRMLEGVSMCGRLEGRIVHLFKQADNENTILRFVLLSKERRPYYQNAPLPMRDEAEILKDAEKKIFVHFRDKPISFASDENYFQIIKKTMSPVYSDDELEIYCRRPGLFQDPSPVEGK